MPSTDTPDAAPAAVTSIPHQLHNKFALLAHQSLFRVAWIFKTESVIMPAFLDSISESGFIRGALPLLNRTGQSLAPLLLAKRLSAAPLKTAWLSRTTFLMGMPFLFSQVVSRPPVLSFPNGLPRCSSSPMSRFSACTASTI